MVTFRIEEENTKTVFIDGKLKQHTLFEVLEWSLLRPCTVVSQGFQYGLYIFDLTFVEPRDVVEFRMRWL